MTGQPQGRDERTTCHCGQPVAYGFDGDPTHHRGMCADCDAVRCDTYPGACRPEAGDRDERTGSLAPNYEVPPEVSPFVPLPVLERCVDCATPLEPWEMLTVSVGGEVTRGLCQACADRRVDAHYRLAAPVSAGEPKENADG